MKAVTGAVVVVAVLIVLAAVASMFGVASAGTLPRFFFASASTVCGVVTVSTVMAGFGSTWAYTPSQTGSLIVTVDFTVWHPAGDHDLNFTLSYGTGAAPSCGAVSAGTAIGQQFATSSSKVTGPTGDVFVSESETVSVSLSVGTAYWFDLQVHPESIVANQVLHPQVTVEES